MAVREVVLDRNRETPHRLHALATLATHADRCFALYIHTPPTGAPGAYGYVMPGGRNDHISHGGAEPLWPAVRAEVLALLDQLARAEPEHPVGMVAAFTAKELQRIGGKIHC
jgi:hypothetical protein